MCVRVCVRVCACASACVYMCMCVCVCGPPVLSCTTSAALSTLVIFHHSTAVFFSPAFTCLACPNQVKSIQTWLKWNKTTVMAELLVVPDTSSTTKKELPRLFKDTFVETFIDERRVAKEALLFELHEITCDGSGDDDDLSSAVSELKSALEAPVTKKHVPSVLVVFRDRFDTALGDVFGGIVSRTVEQEKSVRKGGSGGRGGGGSRGTEGGEGEVEEAEEGEGGEGEEEHEGEVGEEGE